MGDDLDIEWTLKELRALHHVIQLGTVTAAADRMSISQPAVSRLLSNLEAKLKLPLFERQGRNLAPTASALSFFKASQKVFEALENMHFNAADTSQDQIIRIAAPPTYTQGFLQDAVAHFLQSNQNVSVQTSVRSSPAIFDLVSEGMVDIGVSDNALRHEAIRNSAFRRAHMCCFMRKDHPLAKQSEINFHELDNIDLIGLTYRHSSRTTIDQQLAQANVNTRIIVRTSTAASAVSFVRSTNAIAFLSPFPIAITIPDDITFRPVPSGLEYISRFIYPTQIGLKPLTRRFMRSVRSIAAKHNAWSEEMTSD